MRRAPLVGGMFAIVLVMATAGSARAQEHNRLAIGVNYSHRMSSDEDAHARNGVGIKWRVGHGQTGWGWHFGFGWFSTEIDRTIGENRVRLGRLIVRPVTAAYGYTYRLTPRTSIKGAVAGGAAFTRLQRTEDADRVLHALGGGTGDSSLSRVIPIVRPEVAIWYDIDPRFGIGLGAGYTIARPKLDILSRNGTVESARLRADTFHVSAGVVYRIF